MLYAGASRIGLLVQCPGDVIIINYYLLIIAYINNRLNVSENIKMYLSKLPDHISTGNSHISNYVFAI